MEKDEVLLSLKDMKEMREYQEKDVSKYFKYCPLCYAKSSMEFEWGFWKSFMICSECGARWHINYGLTGFHWAKLVKENVEGKGTELLEKKNEPEFWQQMALKGRRSIKEKPKQAVKEKEVIREKEIIIKVRCPYCKKLYDETLDTCPHCGGKR